MNVGWVLNLLLRIAAGCFLASIVCRVAAMFQDTDRPLADTIGYSGLLIGAVVMVFPYGLASRFLRSFR